MWFFFFVHIARTYFQNNVRQHGRLQRVRPLAAAEGMNGWLFRRAPTMTLLGPINSQRLLEHQVMANQAPELQPRLHCADSAPVKARDLQGSQLGPLKKAQWMVLETLHLLLPMCSPLSIQRSTDIRYCVFLLDMFIFACQSPWKPY